MEEVVSVLLWRYFGETFGVYTLYVCTFIVLWFTGYNQYFHTSHKISGFAFFFFFKKKMILYWKAFGNNRRTVSATDTDSPRCLSKVETRSVILRKADGGKTDVAIAQV